MQQVTDLTILTGLEADKSEPISVGLPERRI
jgi:hypothetical protein